MPPRRICRLVPSLKCDTPCLEARTMSSPDPLRRIVIVGGGAAGLELATRLGNSLGKRKLADITLIDKNRTHIWKPKLHEIASGSMDLSAHEVDYLTRLRLRPTSDIGVLALVGVAV